MIPKITRANLLSEYVHKRGWEIKGDANGYWIEKEQFETVRKFPVADKIGADMLASATKPITARSHYAIFRQMSDIDQRFVMRNKARQIAERFELSIELATRVRRYALRDY